MGVKGATHARRHSHEIEQGRSAYFCVKAPGETVFLYQFLAEHLLLRRPLGRKLRSRLSAQRNNSAIERQRRTCSLTA